MQTTRPVECRGCGRVRALPSEFRARRIRCRRCKTVMHLAPDVELELAPVKRYFLSPAGSLSTETLAGNSASGDAARQVASELGLLLLGVLCATPLVLVLDQSAWRSLASPLLVVLGSLAIRWSFLLGRAL